MTVRLRRSIIFVPVSFSLSTSALLPTATMRCPLIATACAIVKRTSTVTILPLKTTMSCAAAGHEIIAAQHPEGAVPDRIRYISHPPTVRLGGNDILHHQQIPK